MIILIPMPLFLKSQISIKKKVILCGVFALGTFTVSNFNVDDYSTQVPRN